MLLQFPEHMNFGNSINSDMKDIKDSVRLNLQFACLMNYYFGKFIIISFVTYWGGLKCLD